MKKRFLVLFISFALILTSIGTFTVATGASTPIPELSIPYCNLSFQNSVCIKYAVKSNVSNVKILIWTAPETEYTVGTQDDEITSYYPEEINGVSHMIFDYAKLTAKQMTDVIYARAYSQVDGVDYYSEVNKYSILQYAYNMLGKTSSASTDDELKEMLTNMLAYGASAQKYLGDYKADRLATADWYQVKLSAGVLDDGCTHGLYLPGDTVTMTAPTTNAEGATFSHWADSKGNKVATVATYELTVGSKNELYTPVYVKYSAGLEFESNGDGTCCLLSMGDCIDTELVIPPTSPEGDLVTEIDGSAFAGEALTSVSFPSTITSIGRKAFNGCDSLTDVYYDGTEEEWLDIDIGTYNSPIENATKHFNQPAVETFTVTFVDHDGRVLKTESVESGKSATAPTDPTREGYTFTGWDKAFDNVAEDLTVTAQYTISSSNPTIVVSDATASAGDTGVEVTVALKNNPGVTSLFMEIAFDDNALDLVSMTYNEEIGGQTVPLDPDASSYTSPIIPYWTNGFNDVTGDWTFVTLIFNVADTAPAGDYNITVSYNENDIFNAAETNIDFDIINGKITVS